MRSCRNRSSFGLRLVTLLSAALAGLTALTVLADSVPFWGAKASVPADTPVTDLKTGEFLWMADAMTAGPIDRNMDYLQRILRAERWRLLRRNPPLFTSPGAELGQVRGLMVNRLKTIWA